MGQYLNPGNDAFCISVNSDIYIDKSELIVFTNNRLEKEKCFLCVSRPRRFGKSMAANMLCAYYSRECNSDSLFRNLKISKDLSYKIHLNQWDVIMINVQQFLRMPDYFETIADYIEQKLVAELRNAYPDLCGGEESSLSEILAAIYSNDKRDNRGFIFIVDEWDCIFREYRENQKEQKAYLNFLRDIFKDRTYVKLAYMTGILPIKKYGTHSALDIFEEFSMTSPKQLVEYIGFTENEVSDLCENYGMDLTQIQHWYDGYQFKQGLHIYNPKSIVDAMMEAEYQCYWTQTETYEALKVYVNMNFDGLKDAVRNMIDGGVCKINLRKFQNDMTTFKSKDDVLTLLVHLGYLVFDEIKQEVFIPNFEITEEFKNAIESIRGWEG